MVEQLPRPDRYGISLKPFTDRSECSKCIQNQFIKISSTSPFGIVSSRFTSRGILLYVLHMWQSAPLFQNELIFRSIPSHFRPRVPPCTFNPFARFLRPRPATPGCNEMEWKMGRNSALVLILHASTIPLSSAGFPFIFTHKNKQNATQHSTFSYLSPLISPIHALYLSFSSHSNQSMKNCIHKS